jgi:hypothetical protein
MKYTIKISKKRYPCFLGNVNITNRGKNLQIGFSINIHTNALYFEPSKINGAAVSMVWGDIVRKEIKELTCEMGNSFLYDEDDILGVKIPSYKIQDGSRLFTSKKWENVKLEVTKNNEKIWYFENNSSKVEYRGYTMDNVDVLCSSGVLIEITY